MSIPETARDILRLFRSGSVDDMRAFILGCPEFPMQKEAANFVAFSQPGSREMALGMVCQGLAFGRATNLGAEVALAAHTLTREAYEEHGEQVILPFTLSRIANEAIHALNVAGRCDEALAFAEEVIPLYEDEPENIASIRVGRITALFELNRIDEAKEFIKEERARRISGPAVIELDRLEKHIDDITGKIFKKKKKRKPRKAGEDLAKENRSQRDFLDKLTGILAGSGEELNQWSVMKIIRDATSIFTDPNLGRDPQRLQASLEQLEVAQAWAKENDSTPSENDALWGMYLCRSRLGRHPEAAEALQALRDNVEETRASITNPVERGGASQTYPFLFEALCKMLTEADRPMELLDAMEGAKGRAVADLLVKRSGKTVDDKTFSRPVQYLPSLMRRNKANYLSFFVDEEETYAVLVAKDGSVHGAGSLPMGQEALRMASQAVDPRTWGVAIDDPAFGEIEDPVDERLSPLLAWLEPLFEDGLLEEGDHICYSPDEHLHHVPLHYVRFRGKSLAATFSVSRTHGAHLLVMSLSRPPAARPAKYVAVEVPGEEDLENTAFMEGIQRAAAWLDERMDGERIVHESATREALVETPLDHCLAHFATHGDFPKEGTGDDRSPYAGSGLLLAGPEGLPDEESFRKGEHLKTMLTPKYVLDTGMNLSGSHVTLQACVSGLAEEGLGGDALGLDWAIMQAGASSLLASHWDVSASFSSEFFVRFYGLWFEEGLSRAEAWRNTVLGLMESGGDLANPYVWAAFSLSGDWR